MEAFSGCAEMQIREKECLSVIAIRISSKIKNFGRVGPDVG